MCCVQFIPVLGELFLKVRLCIKYGMMKDLVRFLEALQRSLILNIIGALLFFLFFFIAIDAGNAMQQIAVCVGMALYAFFIILEGFRTYRNIKSRK
jgi:hypothetical protein